MKVDAPGLVAAAQRLVSAVETLAASGGVPHPPLAADPASVGAAARLTNAGALLTTSLGAHVSALVASLEHLTGAAITFTETDQRNASALTTLTGATAAAAPVAGAAPPPPPIPPDVRAPLPPPAGMMPEALSAAAHTGELSGGAFTGAWSSASGAARDASQHLRSAVAQLPEVLDGPSSTPAASRHLLSFAGGLDTYADRGQALVTQAGAYAGNLFQARQDIPTPEQHISAQQRIQSLSQANAASGGRYAAPLANAVNAKNQLNQQTITGYSGYHENTDTATAGDGPGTDTGTDPTDPTTAGVPGDPAALAPPDPTADPLSPEGAGGMASMLPQMLPTVLGAVTGLAGGLLGSVTKLPEAAMQAGTQAISAATQGLSGLAEPKSSPLDTGSGGDPGPGDLGDMGGGGEAPTTPAGGEGTPALSVAPSTGAPPTPAVTPVGAAASAPASAAMGGMHMGGMPMGGMPMGGMGAPGGGGEGGKEEVGRHRKVVPRDIPHTEDVTGRVDTNRLAVTSATVRGKNPNPPDDDDPPPPESAKPVVRRLTTRPPKEPT